MPLGLLVQSLVETLVNQQVTDGRVVNFSLQAPWVSLTSEVPDTHVTLLRNTDRLTVGMVDVWCRVVDVG